MGVEIAKKLAAPLDLLITKKIGHPFNPEYAIGAITEDADPIFNPGEHGVLDQNWLEWELKRLRQEIKRRRETYVGAANIQSLEGKTAIIVDDGIATGFNDVRLDCGPQKAESETHHRGNPGHAGGYREKDGPNGGCSRCLGADG